MARQIRPGQLQENVLYDISASYAVTASHALNGGGGSTFPFVGDAVITGSLTVSGSNSAVNFQEVQFDTNHSASGHTTGRIYWDDNNKTFTGDMQGSDVRLQIGQEEHIYVFNNSGVTINNGDAVRISGANGANVTITKAVSSIKSFKDETEQDQILGVATEQIADNQRGYVTTFGAVRDLDTSAFSEGDILYLSETTSGSYSNIRPAAPNFEARVGVVQIANATEGVVLVRPQEPTFLTDISQVTSSGVVTDEKAYLVYDDSTNLISFTNEFSGSFSGSYEGDGSQLTGVSANTNFTQSLFVTPAGDDGTAVVGDMLKPFQTILAATASANAGDTIFVYPGTHSVGANIIKEGVNYYFHPGAFVSVDNNISVMNGTYDTVNVRGYGQFEGGGTYGIHGALIELTVNKTSYLEFDYVRTTSTGNSYEANLRVGTSNTDADIEYFKIKGNVEMTGSGGSSLVQALQIQAGNVEFEGRVHVAASKNAGTQAIEINSDVSDCWIKADAYAAEGEALYSSARNPHIKLQGKYETGTQGTYYAMRFNDNYQGQHIIDAEVVGSIEIAPGEVNYGGVKFSGYQTCTNSPSNNGALYIRSGYNQIDASIYCSDDVILHVEGGHTVFNGNAEAAGSQVTKLFDVSAGLLHWKGSMDDNNVRAVSSEISGGELIIDSYLQYFGSTFPSDRFAFNLSGGTLEINNKVVYHQNTTGSGIVNMTGGYLKLNGAQLVHQDQTGSWAYAIKLNGSSHSGSILNNSFTNLTPFGPGSFTNEITGGGTLFYSDKIY